MPYKTWKPLPPSIIITFHPEPHLLIISFRTFCPLCPQNLSANAYFYPFYTLQRPNVTGMPLNHVFQCFMQVSSGKFLTNLSRIATQNYHLIEIHLFLRLQKPLGMQNPCTACMTLEKRIGYSSGLGTLVKNKIKFSSYVRKLRGIGILKNGRQYRSHPVWLTASSYKREKNLRISSFIRKPFLIYDFAPNPIWISLYLRKILFSFLSV
jgi:hypothetical protein